jgi:hypothetical protein
MQGASATRVSLPRWPLSGKLTFACHEIDKQGQPARYQTGHIMLDPNNPTAAMRVGHYTDSAEIYEQRLTMLDNDTIIIPIPEHSTLGDVYAKHGWRRKH